MYAAEKLTTKFIIPIMLNKILYFILQKQQNKNFKIFHESVP